MPSVTTYDDAVRERARLIGLVRSGPLAVEVSDEDIWTTWRELAADGPTSAFDVTLALNTRTDAPSEAPARDEPLAEQTRPPGQRGE